MAAALLAHRAGGRVAVSSAGTFPAAEVEPVDPEGAPPVRDEINAHITELLASLPST
jgi:protein-tyrosine-phosphatase